MKVIRTGSLIQLLIIIILLPAVLAGCRSAEETPTHVSLEKRQPLEPSSDKPVLTVCVGSMITPQEGYGYYRRLLDYIGRKMGGPVRALDPGSYREVNQLLASGKVDAAFVCGGPYVEGRKSFGLELLSAPVVGEQQAYYAYLIVPSESPARTLSDLRGKTFAFTDPYSNSGLFVPTDHLAQMGETPDSFFRSYIFTYAHDRSIRAVSDGLVDGATVASLVWEYVAANQPEMTSKTRIVARYGPYGIPPVVVNPKLDPAIKTKLRQILLNVHLDSEGRDILRGMNIERFGDAEDSNYDSIREVRRRARWPGTATGEK